MIRAKTLQQANNLHYAGQWHHKRTRTRNNHTHTKLGSNSHYGHHIFEQIKTHVLAHLEWFLPLEVQRRLQQPLLPVHGLKTTHPHLSALRGGGGNR